MLDESRLYKSDLSALGVPENLPIKIIVYFTLVKDQLRNFEIFL